MNCLNIAALLDLAVIITQNVYWLSWCKQKISWYPSSNAV